MWRIFSQSAFLTYITQQILGSDIMVVDGGDETGFRHESSVNCNEEVPEVARIDMPSDLPAVTENQESVINAGAAPLIKEESAELHLLNAPGHSNHRKRRKSLSQYLLIF